MKFLDPDDWNGGSYRPTDTEILLRRTALAISILIGSGLGIIVVHAVIHSLK